MGQLQAIASLITFGDPSIKDGNTSTSASFRYKGTSLWDTGYGQTNSTFSICCITACANPKFFPGLVLFPRNNTFFISFSNARSGLNFCTFTPLGMMKDFCFLYTAASILGDLEMMALTNGCISQVRTD